MGRVERQLIEAAIRLLEVDSRPLTEEQILAAAVPAVTPRQRASPSYAYAFERMRRRGLLASQWSGHQVIGVLPTEKAYRELREAADRPAPAGEVEDMVPAVGTEPQPVVAGHALPRHWAGGCHPQSA
jgi:hypothetical protein